jgi:hypothetical protein
MLRAQDEGVKVADSFPFTKQSFLLIGSCLAYWRAVRFVQLPATLTPVGDILIAPFLEQMGPRCPSRTRAEQRCRKRRCDLMRFLCCRSFGFAWFYYHFLLPNTVRGGTRET